MYSFIYLSCVYTYIYIHTRKQFYAFSHVHISVNYVVIRSRYFASFLYSQISHGRFVFALFYQRYAWIQNVDWITIEYTIKRRCKLVTPTRCVEKDPRNFEQNYINYIYIILTRSLYVKQICVIDFSLRFIIVLLSIYVGI